MSDHIVYCPACNSPVDQTDRFCWQCGTFLERPTSGDEHRYVTILFSDLTGYTMLSEELDPEDLRDLMDRILGRSIEIIARYDGSVEKFIGDAIVAFFGVSRVHEDDIIRAIRTAREIHAFVSGLTLPALPEKRLTMHTGIYTGSVLVEKRDIPFLHGALGTPINIAARISSQACPGEILIGETLLGEASRYFELDSRGKKTLKGVRQPIGIYRVVSELPAPYSIHRPGGLVASLIGRIEHLALLKSRAQDLMHDQGSVVCIVGDPGVGKSRLLQEFHTSMGSSIPWYEARCFEYAKDTPYLPIAALMNQIMTHNNMNAAALKLVDFSACKLPAHNSSPEGLQPYAWRARIYADVLALMQNATRGRPLVCCIEDLQWADQSTIDLLSYMLSTESPDYPCLFLLTSRDSQGLSFPGIVIILEDFSYAEARQMICEMLKSEIPEEHIKGLYQKTGGNPFYLEEMVNYLCEKQDPLLTSQSIPPTVKGLISARIDRLSIGAKRLLKMASVIGTSFSLDLLRDISAEDIDAYLAELMRPGLILPLSGKDCVFRHALTRDTAYATLLKRDRISLHRSFAEALDLKYGREQEVSPAALAYHFSCGEEHAKAYHYSMLAAINYQETGSLLEASHHYINAEHALTKVPEYPGRDQEWVRIWEGIWTCTRIFSPDRAISALENLSRYYSERDLIRDEVFAKIRLINLYSQKALFKNAFDIFREVLVKTEDDAVMRGAAETAIAYAFTYLGRPEMALEYLTFSRKSFSPSDSFLLAVNSLMTLTALVWKGSVPEALTWYQNTRTLCKGQSDMEMLSDIWLGYLNYLMGNFRRADQIFMEAFKAEQMLGAIAGALSYIRTQSSIYFNARYKGDLKQAREDLHRFERFSDDVHVAGSGALMDLYRGWISLEEGDYIAARSLLGRALPALKTGIANRVPYALNALAETLLHMSDWESAKFVAREGIAWNREHGNQEQFIGINRIMGEICLKADVFDEAKEALFIASRTARRLRMRPHVAWTLATWGDYWEKIGDRKKAKGCRERAQYMWQTMGNPYQACKIRNKLAW